jgi:hypothetical protein
LIYYFMPYDTRGLGFAYNRHCALVPEDTDWICLMDIDTMFFSSQRMGEQLEQVITEFGSKFSAFTCVTNRAFRQSQQQLMNIRDERDLVKLKQRADFQTRTRQGKVEELRTPLNGQFLLFPKSLWRQYPFAEVGRAKKAPGHHILGIDTDWRERLYADGRRIGLIHQLMAVHFYRMDDPAELVGHLPKGNEWWRKTSADQRAQKIIADGC